MPKDKVINIRVSESDHAELVRLAGSEGVSRYMLRMSLNVYTKTETVYTNDKNVYTKDKTVYTKPVTKDDKRKALSSVTVQHSPTCQCFMCRPSA
jgi:hypothetical protein